MSSGDLLSQQKVWNHRAANWENGHYGEPRLPGKLELDFQRELLVPGGKALILGATRPLCELALERSSSVTSVDFAPNVIETLRINDVEYICQDWITFLENATGQYDNIMSDSGITCLQFPEEWERISEAIYSRLKPGGIFSPRAILSTGKPPRDHYENPDLGFIVPFIATVDENWMAVKPASEYDPYPARYAFPPSEIVEQVFGRLNLVRKLVPDYEGGEHFVSFAFQRPIEA